MYEPSLSDIEQMESAAPVLDQEDPVRCTVCISAEIADFPHLQDGILAAVPGNALRIHLAALSEADCYRYCDTAFT